MFGGESRGLPTDLHQHPGELQVCVPAGIRTQWRWKVRDRGLECVVGFFVSFVV